MTWPFTFGTATSPVAASHLDDMFNQSAAMTAIPCAAAGANAIALTPLPNCPALTAYSELGGYRFRAAGNSTAAVTASYNGLAFLPVYHADGTTQAGTGDLVAGQEFILIYSAALNAGAGGFFLEAPAVAVAANPWFAPGGRLALQATQPIPTANITSANVIYYVPYNSQWCPIYNGSVLQPVQFSSPLSNQSGPSLNMGGAANFPTNTLWDLFLTLIAGVPTLVAVAWSSLGNRAVGLATIGGVLTNAGTTTVQTGPNLTATLLQNQGTFLGTMFTAGGTPGVVEFVFNGSGSGGFAGSFGAHLANYYNSVPFALTNIDNGAAYTYTPTTFRPARNSTNNSISFCQPSAERAYMATYRTRNAGAAASANGVVGFAIQPNNLTVPNFFTKAAIFQSYTNGANITSTLAYSVGINGLSQVYAMEGGDGTNANSFTVDPDSVLQVTAWL